VIAARDAGTRQVRPPVSTLLLASTSGLSTFGMASIVPALPAFATEFAADYTGVQFVVSAYLLGLGLAQPLQGAICDAFGRRRALLSGFLVFIAASLFCAFATRLDLLIAGRMMQALGVSVGTVASRAIVRDTHDAEQSGIALAYITAAMGVVPVLAPMAGGFLVAEFSWPAIFVTNAALAAALVLWTWRKLPETHDPRHRVALDPVRTLLHYVEFMRSPEFLGNSMVYGFTSGAMFAFIIVGATLFERYAGLDAARFGLLWGLLALAYAGGAWLGARIAPRRGMRATLRDGVAATVVVGLAFPVVLALVGATFWTLLLPIAALMVANGLSSPLALAGAISSRPELAGIASGLSSALAMLTSMAFTAASGAVFDGTAMPAALLIAAATLATGGAWLMIRHEPSSPERPSA
jgi:MFS transporter, DHA1 family, multidrug resistance protein